jgi:hypothetical protein
MPRLNTRARCVVDALSNYMLLLQAKGSSMLILLETLRKLKSGLAPCSILRFISSETLFLGKQ